MNKLGARTWLSLRGGIGLAGAVRLDDREHVFQRLSVQHHLHRPDLHRIHGRGKRGGGHADHAVHGRAVGQAGAAQGVHLRGGYLLWGLSTLSFGFITVENAARWFPAANAAHAAALLVVVMDCVMTFFGSTANDAALQRPM